MVKPLLQAARNKCLDDLSLNRFYDINKKHTNSTTKFKNKNNYFIIKNNKKSSSLPHQSIEADSMFSLYSKIYSCIFNFLFQSDSSNLYISSINNNDYLNSYNISDSLNENEIEMINFDTCSSSFLLLSSASYLYSSSSYPITLSTNSSLSIMFLLALLFNLLNIFILNFNTFKKIIFLNRNKLLVILIKCKCLKILVYLNNNFKSLFLF
jgi:hypothetical protein